MPTGGKKTIDFSSFDDAVKDTGDNKQVDFSAFDDAVKKKSTISTSPTKLPSNAPLSLSERMNQAVENPKPRIEGFNNNTFGQRKQIPVKPKVEEQPTDNLFTPKNKITAPDGIELPVAYNWDASPQLHNEVVDKLQADINVGNITPEVVNATSKLTGKSPQATAAYLQGDPTTGNAFDRTDALKKNAEELNGIIQKANADFGWNSNPAEILGNADLTSKWLSKYLLTLKESDPVQAKKDEAEAQGRDLDIETLNTIILNDKNLQDKIVRFKGLVDGLNPRVEELKNHIVNQVGKESYAKGESSEQAANKIALLTNPIGYKNAQEALKKPFGFDRLSDQSNLGDIVGGLADEIGGDKTFKDQMLNSVLDEAKYKLNETYKKNAEDQAAVAHLSQDPDMLNEAKLMYAKYNKDILNTLPSLHMAKMANEVSSEIATEAGQLLGTDTENYRLKLAGASQEDIIGIMQKKGWFTDPNKKALAIQIATHPEMVKDASYFGGVKENFLQPFKDLGLSLLDVSDVRTFKDRVTDKFKEELFPREFSDEETKSAFSIYGHDFKTRHIVNGISNLAGLTVGNIITEGVAGEVGMSANAAKRLSAYVTFGIPSIDANLKDSYNFINNDLHRAAYVTLGTLINGEGGALLDLGKISRVPGLQAPMEALSKNLVEKNLSTEAKDELLNVAKNKYVDFVKKWGKVGLQGGKNTIEGAATMAYFGFANQYNKLLNGDPNTKAEDLLPTAGNAFVDGIFTMIPFGFIRAVKETKNNPNSTYKEMINKLSVMPTAAEDILRMGSKSPEDFNYKMSVVNTARAAKNSLDATEQATGINLNPDQRSVYVANKTIEAVLRDKASKINDKGKREQLEAQADELAEQSTKTLDGLKFTPTLEPLYDLYDAEKRYNKALDDFQNSGGTDDRRLVEAKKNYERLQYKYFNDTKPAEEVKQPEEKTFTDFDKTLFHEGKLTPLGEDIKARIAKGENITVLTSRENTPANVDFISQTLGIPTENIKAGLDAKGKANELTAYSGKKVFYDDNPDNVAEAQKTDARVVNTGLTPEQQIVQDNADDIKNPIYRDVVKAATKGEDIDGVLKEVSDQWHDLRSRNQAEDGFPKPIIEAAKKLYPQEENAGLEIKSDPEQPKVTEGSGLNEDANKILGLHDNGANFDLFDNNKLRQIAKDNGINLPEGTKNYDIIEALKNKRKELSNKNNEVQDVNESIGTEDNTETILATAEKKGGIYAQLAKAVKNLLGGVKTTVYKNLSDFAKYVEEEVSTHGAYDESNQTIHINNSTDKNKLHIFFHEAIHHITISKIKEFEKNPNSKNLTTSEYEAILNLKRIFKKVSEKVNQDRGGFGTQKGGNNINNWWALGDRGTDRGFANVHEFISEAFTNPEFQKILKDFKGEGKSPNIFKQFLDAVAKILGIKDPTILDDIFHHTEKLIEGDKAVEQSLKEKSEQPNIKDKPVTEGSGGVDIETKKADIERRRQEELDRLLKQDTERFWNTAFENTLEEFKQLVKEKFNNSDAANKQAESRWKVSNQIIKKQFDKINAKYDTELATLDKPVTEGSVPKKDISAEQPNIKEQINEEPQVEVPNPTKEEGVADEGVNKESGAAKEVKKENEPITVYRSGEVNSDAPYFAETKEYADKFGEQKGADVSEVKINPKNVLDITEDYSESTSPKEVQKLLEEKGVEFTDAEKRSIASFEDNYKGDPTFSHIANIPAFTEAIKRSGFDAVKQKEGLPNAEGKFDELHPSYLVTDPSIIMDKPSRKAAEAEAVRKQYLADKQKEVGYQEFSNNNDRYQREAERAKREYLSGKKENVFDALDKAAESKKSVREKERAMENAAAEMGEDGKRALAINKNFEDILKHLKENKKIEIKCP